jgi:nucleoside phosphorylase
MVAIVFLCPGTPQLIKSFFTPSARQKAGVRRWLPVRTGHIVQGSQNAQDKDKKQKCKSQKHIM